jgi:acetyltransferase-like isoleucine patch superfamily enzyme
MSLNKKIYILKYYLFKFLKIIYWNFLSIIPIFRKIRETKGTQTPITFSIWFYQKILGINKYAYWPVHRTSLIQGIDNIIIGIETSPGLMPNCYIEACYDNIFIGDYTQIGPSVGILSSNHSLTDNRVNESKGPIKIGKYCWLGMGCKILSGVELGDYTVVGANAVVTKSFPAGYCVIAGNPAKIIKEIPKEKCIKHESKYKYIGYLKAKDFEIFKLKNLKKCVEF